MNKIIRNFSVTAIAIPILLALMYALPHFVPLLSPLRHEATVTVPDGTKYMVEIADDEAERARGLSNLSALKEHEGKLFVFPSPGRYTFWMKGMRFPIDILWLNKGVIVDRVENAPAPKPGASVKGYLPEADADLVLEIAAGEVKQHGLTLGTPVDIHFPAGYSAPTN